MDARELKIKYLDFFKKKGHAVIKSAPLIPEHDPAVLFTTAGMHPLIPFLLGQPHPAGRRLVGVQKCLRTDDIEDIDDDSHLTFFEMIGNWSLGDYFKKEAITWSYEFLVKVLGINSKKLHVTVFKGDKAAPRDKESAEAWLSLGIPKNRIYFLPKEDNWWGLESGPCGPCSEIFIDSGVPGCSAECRPGCGCGKYFEVWNNVFMEYNKIKDGGYERLRQKNVDTGMGVERMVAMLQNRKSVYDTELFIPLINAVKSLAKRQGLKSLRIIVDHARAATFILGDERGVAPSNLGQGYVLRRLIRRAIRHARLLGIEKGVCQAVAEVVIKNYAKEYPILDEKHDFIIKELVKEEERFLKTLERGLRIFEKIARNKSRISGRDAFLLYQSYGFPIEMTQEIAVEKGIKVDVKGFTEAYEKHRGLSRVSAGKKFKGGLADASEETIKLHTVTHLLAEALRRVLKKEVRQKGSNITPERLRFDFSFDRKLTEDELRRVEDLVNEKIKTGLRVWHEQMTFEKARKAGAHAEFKAKYGEKVFVYFIGDFSKEVCGGPHVKNTRELGKFRIVKEKSIAAGVRRIRAVLEL